MKTYVKDIDDIRKHYEAGGYTDSTEIPKKVQENHIFDADLSVNRNREMVKEHNAKVDELRMAKAQNNRELSKKLTADVIAYIVDSYGFSEAQAKIINDWVYEEKHSCMYDYFMSIDDICDLITDVNEAK